MTKRNRTDAHRPGAIIPANYEYVFSYNGASSSGGWPVPSYGINCEIDQRTVVKNDDGTETVTNGKHADDGHCCVTGLLHVAKVKFGGGSQSTCKCGVCGVHFVYGDVWKHLPTSEYIHIGHTCSDKYSLLADRSAYELQLDRLRAAAAVQCKKAKNEELRTKFLANYPGLERALQTNHPIVRDIASKFTEYRSLSERQVNLVFKLHGEVEAACVDHSDCREDLAIGKACFATRPVAQVEVNVPAPVSVDRQTFEGVIVSTKVQDSNFGSSYKMTVKVTTPTGVWLAWGTVPQALLDATPPDSQGSRLQTLRGATVKITARLEQGRGPDAKPHFVFMNRPSAKLVALRTQDATNNECE